MAKTEYAKLRCAISECKTFEAASASYTAGTPVKVGDIIVYPLQTTTSASAVVAYDVPGLQVTKYESTEVWVAGKYVYWRDVVENTNHYFTNVDPDPSIGLEPVGIILEASASGTTTGVIHLMGYGILQYA